MYDPINLSAYADPILDELVSGEPKIDGTIFLDLLRQAKKPILELGCGYGRITIPLAQRGITELTGLEFCGPSLEYARARTGDLPICWVEADVRKFHLEERYELIFARGGVFDFMLTRADQEAMLARVHEHLADDGQFIFDVCNLPPNAMINEPEEVEWFSKVHPNGRQIYFSGITRYDLSKQQYFQKCYERWDSPDGKLVREPWELTLRYTMPQEMEALLHYNGFKIIKTYAEWDGTPGTAERPESIYICEKI